jgi:DNA-binding transcriptional MerR regulator
MRMRGLSRHTDKTVRPSTAPSLGNAPAIPDKLYFRIGEVAKLCSVQAYVLRFWESEFPQLKPSKSGTGQRLYRQRDVEMALKIRHLLYEEGYTIPGARQAFQLEARGTSLASSRSNSSSTGRQEQSELPLGMQTTGSSPVSVQRLKNELREILGILSTPTGRSRSANERKSAVKPQLFD